MTKEFPPAFRDSIQGLLGLEAYQFWASYQDDPAQGLRIHSKKASLAEIQAALPGSYTPLPWSEDGYRFESEGHPGKHPYHGAGLFYLQEPSAMAPAVVLDPKPGERVLDLCAAPGGKSTQLSALMDDQGILIANDPNPHRVQALARNLERWGARNAAVVSETPRRLSEHFGPSFDRVLVDAPCSGEGMFRSDPPEIKKWSRSFRDRCAALQDEILWFAGKLVRPGGTLVYSTCTFNQLENEGSVARFLDKSPGFDLEPIPPEAGFSPGIKLEGDQELDLSGTVRIWPHTSPGEGHFIARLRNSRGEPGSVLSGGQAGLPLSHEQESSYERFFSHTLALTDQTSRIQPGSPEIVSFGNRLYWVPEQAFPLEGLSIIHWGWWLGTFQGGQFQPGPALASSLRTEDVQMVLEFPLEDPRLSAYLRGSPLKISSRGREGWTLVATTGHPLGWGRLQNGRLKSYYPRWLRWN